MTTREIVLCGPVRTAIGAYNGSLKTIPAPDLGATVVRETLRRSGLDAAAIGSVVMGNVIQAGNKMNPARQAAIGGGLPVVRSGHDGEPRLRLRGSGHRHRRAADRDRRGGRRHRGRHGEHGPRPVPDGRRPLGLPHGPRRDP